MVVAAFTAHLDLSYLMASVCLLPRADSFQVSWASEALAEYIREHFHLLCNVNLEWRISG